MLTLDEINANGVAVLRAGGQISKDDYDRILPEIEAAIERHDKVKFYVDLQGFDSMDPDALLKDLRFDARFKDHYGKTAIVGDKQWQAWLTKLSDAFMQPPMRFFETEQADEAWMWVNQ